MAIVALSIIDAVSETIRNTEGSTIHYDPAVEESTDGEFEAITGLGLVSDVRAFIGDRFSDGLFRHQHAAIRSVLEGQNTVTSTRTSSGKSLIYSAPTLNTLCVDDQATALFLYPQKALANDQLLKLRDAVEAVPLLKSAAPYFIKRSEDGAQVSNDLAQKYTPLAKRYKAKTYYFPARDIESKESSYRRCWAEWESKKIEIDQTSFDNGPSREMWESALQLIQSFNQNAKEKGLPNVWRETHELEVLTKASIAAKRNFPGALDGNGQPLPDSPPLSTDILGKPAWDQLPEPTLESVGANVTKFLEQQSRKVESGQLSAGRFEALRHCMSFFQNWLGATRPVASIDGNTLIEYHAKVMLEIKRGNWSAYYGRDHWIAAKRFIKWCWSATPAPVAADPWYLFAFLIASINAGTASGPINAMPRTGISHPCP